jgi:hypothetical protein
MNEHSDPTNVPAEPLPAPTAPKAQKPKAAKPKAAPKKAAPKPAAKKAAPKKAKPVGDRLVPADLSTYVVSKDVKTAGGNPSIDSGDEVAEKLRGRTLDEVYKIASKALKVDEKELRARYKGLNLGMQRMNLGNRIRGALAKADAKTEKAKK